MPRSCVVPTCESSFRKDRNLGYHEFPCDAERRQVWLRNIFGEGPGGKTTKWVPSDKSLVCSLHFTEQDYRATNKLRLLLPTAVPTVFPAHPSCTTTPSVEEVVSRTSKKAVVRGTRARRRQPRPKGTENVKHARGAGKWIASQNNTVLDRHEGAITPRQSEPAVENCDERPSVKDETCQTRRLQATIAVLRGELQTVQCKLDEAEERAHFYENNKDIDCFMRVLDAAAHGDETAVSIMNQVYSFHGEAEFAILGGPAQARPVSMQEPSPLNGTDMLATVGVKLESLH
ncbi:uncharacterized protein LOC142587753 [Dermacentor variabilis]|uniref:uncharacterized protein LOC142587753 n=1 Tax=Dermacentor variabilis TaxID=34621 RepID=UPI003F5CAA10